MRRRTASILELCRSQPDGFDHGRRRVEVQIARRPHRAVLDGAIDLVQILEVPQKLWILHPELSPEPETVGIHLLGPIMGVAVPGVAIAVSVAPVLLQ